MTRPEFLKAHGPEWAKFATRPIFKALVELLQEESPLYASSEQLPGNIVVGGNVLYAEASGYQKVIRGLKTLGVEKTHPKLVDSDYKEPSV